MRLPLHLPLLFSSFRRPEPPDELVFTPRHAHSQSLETGAPLFLANADAGIAAFGEAALRLRTRKTTIRRPRTRPPHMLSWAHAAAAARVSGVANATGWIAPMTEGEWEDIEIDGPDITDRQTLLSLAKMASNAYTTPDGDGWYPLPGFNRSTPVGWEPDADGLRGHVFADDKNTTVIVAIKGTSAGVLGSGGPTAKNDKFNDNLLFSCCCARVDFSWSTVCDCYAGGYKCEQTCLEKALVEESVYATVGTNLYNNITYMYPNANIWVTGHSLGGSLSALIGLAFGAPAVGFESPGDRLPSRRLHLPGPPAVPPELSGITHVYHTADPIPMGACTGTYSGCYAAGFALESKCHSGQTILYDTVTVKGWSVDVRTHRITEVINKVLADPWPVHDPKHPDKPDKPGKHKPGKDKPGKGGDGEEPGEPDDDPWGDDPWGWALAAASLDPVAWSGIMNGRLWEWPLPGRKRGGKEKDKDEDDDGGHWEKHGGVPKAEPENDCVDCYKWEFGDNWDKK